MTHIIILYIMTSPGAWTTQEIPFDTYEECHRFVHVLEDYNTHKPRFRDIPGLYKNPKEGFGIMFVEKC